MRDEYINTVVKEYYQAPGIAESYARRTDLQPPEIVILDALRDELLGARVLDIGVGAGRTTPHVRAFAGRYVGIDYSPAMLRLCRARHPDAELLHCDARRMPFPAAAFDAVFIFWNALDDVSHDDRIMILREARRVLRDGGLLVFSSHNRHSRLRSAYRPPHIAWAGGVVPTIAAGARALAKYGRGIINHLRTRRYEQRTPEYALLNDQSYSYRLLAYYIAVPQQRAQLTRMGFEPLRALGTDGRDIDAGGICEDAWIYYVARRG